MDLLNTQNENNTTSDKEINDYNLNAYKVKVAI